MNINGITTNTSLPEAMPRTVAQAEDRGYDKASIKQMTRSGKIECETCASRKYKDGSDEMVSFKSPAYIPPQSAASAVRSHEQEHVSNAYKKAANNNGEVMQASVRIKTSKIGRAHV